MEIRKAYSDCSGGQVHYRMVAGAGVPVIFFHQTASSGQMWIKTMERLAGGWPLYAFDTPGFGGSFDAPADMKPPMSAYVDWLYEAVRDAGIDHCHIVGHHTGSCIGVEMAARYPDLARTLTMVGPVPLTDEERAEFSKHFGLPFTPVVSGSYLLEKLGVSAQSWCSCRPDADAPRNGRSATCLVGSGAVLCCRLDAGFPTFLPSHKVPDDDRGSRR